MGQGDLGNRPEIIRQIIRQIIAAFDAGRGAVGAEMFKRHRRAAEGAFGSHPPDDPLLPVASGTMIGLVLTVQG